MKNILVYMQSARGKEFRNYFFYFSLQDWNQYLFNEVADYFNSLFIYICTSIILNCFVFGWRSQFVNKLQFNSSYWIWVSGTWSPALKVDFSF